MSETKHTAGPWKRGFQDATQVFAGPEQLIADCCVSVLMKRDECLANARLIAASPGLLAACQALLDAGHPDGRYLAVCQQEDWARAVDAARTAIASARGA
jgi:hypothetical protein